MKQSPRPSVVRGRRDGVDGLVARHEAHAGANTNVDRNVTERVRRTPF